MRFCFVFSCVTLCALAGYCLRGQSMPASVWPSCVYDRFIRATLLTACIYLSAHLNARSYICMSVPASSLIYLFALAGPRALFSHRGTPTCSPQACRHPRQHRRTKLLNFGVCRLPRMLSRHPQLRPASPLLRDQRKLCVYMCRRLVGARQWHGVS